MRVPKEKGQGAHIWGLHPAALHDSWCSPQPQAKSRDWQANGSVSHYLFHSNQSISHLLHKQSQPAFLHKPVNACLGGLHFTLLLPIPPIPSGQGDPGHLSSPKVQPSGDQATSQPQEALMEKVQAVLWPTRKGSTTTLNTHTSCAAAQPAPLAAWEVLFGVMWYHRSVLVSTNPQRSCSSDQHSTWLHLRNPALLLVLLFCFNPPTYIILHQGLILSLYFLKLYCNTLLYPYAFCKWNTKSEWNDIQFLFIFIISQLRIVVCKAQPKHVSIMYFSTVA
jgi:hypothetical protein